MNLFNRHGRALLLTAVAGVICAASAAAESTDSAFVPIIANTDATIRVEYTDETGDGRWRQFDVIANKLDTLRLPPQKIATGVRHSSQNRVNTPVLVNSNRGVVTVNLAAQSYKNAEIALYSINGKSILRKNVTAASAANRIFRRNVTPGVYMLSISGNGSTSTTRLTHNHGPIDINVVFNGEGLSSTPRMAKNSEERAKWTIKVTAQGWTDTSYTLVEPFGGYYEKQVITLKLTIPFSTTAIGKQTWMAENLRYVPPTGNSWCYDNADSNCTKFGRLYDWEAASKACPASWHLPTMDEWKTLITFISDLDPENGVAGRMFRATAEWTDWSRLTPEELAERFPNTYGFSALPAGKYWPQNKKFDDLGDRTYWWTATDEPNDSFVGGTGRDVELRSQFIKISFESKLSGMSVRCIKNKK